MIVHCIFLVFNHVLITDIASVGAKQKTRGPLAQGEDKETIVSIADSQ